MASASVDAAGFLDLLDRLERSNDTVKRRAAVRLNAEFRRQMQGATKGETGRLHRSLTTNNEDHIFRITPTSIQMGSKDPAARYQRRGKPTVPPLEPRPFFEILTVVLFADIRSGGAQRRG